MFFLAYHSSRVALIRKEKNSFYIEHLSLAVSDVNPLYKLNSLIMAKKFEIVTGLETRDVLLRTLILKLKSKREVLAALPFQIESIIPYPQNELLLLPTLYSTKGETEVFLLATSQSTLNQHLSQLAKLEIDPDIVSCVPLALFRFASYFFPKHPTLFIYHAEGDQHTFVIVKEGKLCGCQIHKSQDFNRMCTYLEKKYPEIEYVLNTGKGNLISPFLTIEMEDSNLAEFAIPIGLAFDAAKGDLQSGQFRQNHLLSNKFLKKRKSQLIGFIAACGCFIFITLFLGQISLRKQENAILESLGAPKGTRLQELTLQLEKSLHSQKKPAFNVPTIPKLHEVLTWLSTHPQLGEDCSITRLRYQVVKAPKLGTQVKNYAATLDLELSISSTKVARAVHEALLKDNVMVDQKNPLQWKGDHGVYHAQFHLKSKQAR